MIETETALERRFWRFWLSGLLLLAIMIAMNTIFVNDVSPWGIRDHQSANSAARVDAIQLGWAQAGVLDWARFSIAVDLVYIAIYSFGAWCGGRLFAASQSTGLRRLGWVIAASALMLGTADYAETICQFIQVMELKGNGSLARIAATAQPIKSVAFLITFFGMILALFIGSMARRRLTNSQQSINTAE